MIKSMTAFGRSVGTVGGKNITVEIKSVNNRFLDCSVKLPRRYGAAEDKIKPYLQSRGITRGKIDVYIGVTSADGSDVSVGLDTGYLKGYLDALYILRDQYGLRDDISVMNIAGNRDIFIFEQQESDTDKDTADIISVLSDAVDAFLGMRASEGENIARDLSLKRKHLEELTGIIAEQEPRSVEAYRERLEAKLRSVLEDRGMGAPDEARIITECALFADKVAVDEETVRLRSHFSAFDKALVSDEPVGRRLDFLLQEMGREVNTIGSKVSDIKMTDTVVEMKSELERIREQVQNIE